MITRVTITGADNTIHPNALVVLSKKYPFVEWGILFSRSSQGSNRFPSVGWLTKLREIKQIHPDIKLSAHLCGAYVRQLLLGDGEMWPSQQLFEFWPLFERVQINTGGQKHKYDTHAMIVLLRKFGEGKDFIFQYDNANTEVLLEAKKWGVNCSALFDLSHGAGILPSDWRVVLFDIPCGYAGGLGPHNLKEQIAKIEAKAKENEIWIDMETHVRDKQTDVFSLPLVEECLQISANWMYGPKV